MYFNWSHLSPQCSKEWSFDLSRNFRIAVNVLPGSESSVDCRQTNQSNYGVRNVRSCRLLCAPNKHKSTRQPRIGLKEDGGRRMQMLEELRPLLFIMLSQNIAAKNGRLWLRAPSSDESSGSIPGSGIVDTKIWMCMHTHVYRYRGEN
jgi:hypothetical protein